MPMITEKLGEESKPTSVSFPRSVPLPLQPEAHGYRAAPGGLEPAPLERPPFTLKDIRDAVPAHCFERSTARSLCYALRDVGICAGLFWASTWLGHWPLLPDWVSWILWPLYWLLQGTFMFSLWVLGHECWHEAFSEHATVNDIVGLLLHTFALFPYHNYRISHGLHHMNTNSMENEAVVVPRTRSQVTRFWVESLEDSPLFNLLRLPVLLALSTPLYLVFNSHGPQKNEGKNANHFSPRAVIFLPEQSKDIVISNAFYFSWVGILIYFSYAYSFRNVVFYYGIPDLVCYCMVTFMAIITHTDNSVPFFRGEEWSWLRGALSTLDHSCGKMLDGAVHHVLDTHVCHHLFPKMPFYHAVEATAAFSPVLGKYHLVDKEPIWKALWRVARTCKFVEDQGPVAFYKAKLSN